MHVSSKARRAIANINNFLPRNDYRPAQRMSYETTKASLRIHLSELTSLLYKESRREDSRGSHYVSCRETGSGCRCSADNQRIETICQEVQYLLRGVS
jgi:hypothetical protein